MHDCDCGSSVKFARMRDRSQSSQDLGRGRAALHPDSLDGDTFVASFSSTDAHFALLPQLDLRPRPEPHEAGAEGAVEAARALLPLDRGLLRRRGEVPARLLAHGQGRGPRRRRETCFGISLEAFVFQGIVLHLHLSVAKQTTLPCIGVWTNSLAPMFLSSSVHPLNALNYSIRTYMYMQHNKLYCIILDCLSYVRYVFRLFFLKTGPGPVVSPLPTRPCTEPPGWT